MPPDEPVPPDELDPLDELDPDDPLLPPSLDWADEDLLEPLPQAATTATKAVAHERPQTGPIRTAVTAGVRGFARWVAIPEVYAFTVMDRSQTTRHGRSGVSTPARVRSWRTWGWSGRAAEQPGGES